MYREMGRLKQPLMSKSCIKNLFVMLAIEQNKVAGVKSCLNKQKKPKRFQEQHQTGI